MFHVEPEAVSRRSAFVGSGRPAVLSDEGSAAVLGDRRLSIRPARFHVKRAGLQFVAVPADPAARTGRMFHVEPEAVSGGTAPSDSDARTGRLVEKVQRSAPALPLVDPDAHAHQVLGGLRRCSRSAPQTRTSGRAGCFTWNREPVSGRTTPLVRTPGPDESVETLRRWCAVGWRSSTGGATCPSGSRGNRAGVRGRRRGFGRPGGSSIRMSAARFHVEPRRCSCRHSRSVRRIGLGCFTWNVCGVPRETVSLGPPPDPRAARTGRRDRCPRPPPPSGAVTCRSALGDVDLQDLHPAGGVHHRVHPRDVTQASSRCAARAVSRSVASTASSSRAGQWKVVAPGV